ncbi:HAD family hydrolase [Candidatus Woesearchaeota archaeon]|jgi:phosphoglycolate phosphatase|nr:HAD family hydrolase [Candidatus Woesearchaeota archaeon]MBT3538262.1 HAD family hydrolase [Candidatus Woesearchaeota archaeon]MBT4697166.1 HAD family hydrolase [Candidatus Woesearchaeota archaeon]MBT4717428.1 HAD family hydrolase [Candidatus Woesearchaeota archaeon]MBT7105931.1 HAD family hydrolase [Candidatus Woesearchaeota archaeon]
MKLKIKQVIFDYNGTITNDAEIGFRATNILLKHYKAPEIDMQRFKDTFRLPWQEFFIENGVKEEQINIITHQDIYRESHKMLSKEFLKLQQHTKETLEFLRNKGIKIGLLTVRNKKDLTEELNSLGITELFHSISCGNSLYQDGTKCEKNTEKIVKELNITNPEEVLMAGDMLIDIKTARENNFISVAIPNGWQSAERLANASPDYLLDDIQQIQELVKCNSNTQT